MSRGTFKGKGLRELDGGINTENSPNEIDDKQCIESVNFNFDGNKLVNSKGSKEYKTGQDVIFNNGAIKSIDVIDNNIYVTYLDSSIKIMRGDNNEWKNSSCGLKNHFYYIPSITIGNTYSITVAGVGFTYTQTFNYTAVSGDTVTNVYNNLLSQMSSSIYVKEMLGFIKIAGVDTAGLFFWNFSAGVGYLTATTTGGGILVDSQNITNTYNPNLFKSGNDLVLVRPSNRPIYLTGLIDDNSAAGTLAEAYFATEIDLGDGIYPSIGTYYNGKLLFSTGYDNILYFSKTSSAIDTLLVMDFGGYDAGLQRVGGDGKITGIITGENGIYVFKEDEIYYSNSVQDDGEGFAFIFNRITNNGAKDKYCITRVGQDIFYYDGINKKIRRLSYEQNLTTLRDTSVSNEIDSLLQAQPTEYGIQQKLYYSYPNLRFACKTPTNNTVYNDIIYVYNVDRKSWTIEDNKAVKFGYGKYFTKEQVPGKVFEDDYSYETDGKWLSKEYDLGDAIMQKRFGEIEIYGKNLDGIDLFLDVYIDGDLHSTFTTTNNFGDYFRNRFDLYQDGRYIQFRLRYEGVGYIEINEIKINYKPIKNFIDIIG